MLGQVIRRWREDREVTQAELADRLGIATSFVSLLESGARQPSYETLVRLADVMGITLDELSGRAPGAVVPPIAPGDMHPAPARIS